MKLLLLIFISFQFVFIKGQEPCPFNEQECTCTKDFKHPKSTTIFADVNCTSLDGALPKFEALPEAKYNITSYFAIYDADLSVIPAGHFKAFQHIRWLNLNQTRQKPATQQWDDTAFEGVELLALEIHRVGGVIPVPKAIQNLGIILLHVSRGPSPLYLEDNSFPGMSDLNYLEIDHTIIESISQKAFAGLENNLEAVGISKAEISELSVVTKAFRGFKSLTNINLAYNWIKEIKRDDLTDLPLLTNFDLSGNPVANIEQGAFPSDLIYLRCVTLANAIMPTFDVSTFVNITKETILPSLSNFNLFLTVAYIKTLTTTITDKFATSGYIGAVNTGLETVDPKIGDLVNNVPDLYLDISFNTNLKCDTLNWLSKFDCPGRINIDNTRCADHNQQPLEDYLKSVDPDSTCHESHQGGIEFFYC